MIEKERKRKNKKGGRGEQRDRESKKRMNAMIKYFSSMNLINGNNSDNIHIWLIQ